MLIHQIPNSPAYLRVKMWRRLQKIGAAAVKNAVYVLPLSDQASEDFHWVAREIMEAGGDASVCEATFIEGLKTSELMELFRAARESDYGELSTEVKDLGQELRRAQAGDEAWASAMAGRVARIRQRLTEIQNIDFFPGAARKQAELQISELETKIRKAPIRRAQQQPGSYSGRTWAFLRIVIPQIRPSIVAAWLAVFIFTFGELGTTLLVTPPGVSTLPVRVYTLIANSHEGEMATLALLQVVATVILICIFVMGFGRVKDA